MTTKKKKLFVDENAHYNVGMCVCKKACALWKVDWNVCKYDANEEKKMWRNSRYKDEYKAYAYVLAPRARVSMCVRVCVLILIYWKYCHRQAS